MEFYGKYDIALGGFLQRYCFRPDYVCPSESCSVAMLHHTRRFVHNSGALHVTLTRTSSPFKHDTILMWNWCKICNYVSVYNLVWMPHFFFYLYNLSFSSGLNYVQAHLHAHEDDIASYWLSESGEVMFGDHLHLCSSIDISHSVLIYIKEKANCIVTKL